MGCPQWFTFSTIRVYTCIHKEAGAANMSTTKVFKSGNSQAVRIPSDIQFERLDIDYEIERIGDEIRVRPVQRRLTSLVKKFGDFTEDFMATERGTEEESERTKL